MRNNYINHYLMKQNRKQKIKETNGLCEICGSLGKHIHHKDLSKNNHNLENLIFLCVKCHKKMHKEEKNTFYKKIYGLTVLEMVKKYGYNKIFFYKLHKQAKLWFFIIKMERK